MEVTDLNYTFTTLIFITTFALYEYFTQIAFLLLYTYVNRVG